MYKKQMTLQRIVCYLILVASALVFIYSLGLVTDMRDNGFGRHAEFYPDYVAVKGTEVYYIIQDFNRQLTAVGLVLILLAVAQLVFRNHVRRKYYIANYITVGVGAAANIGATIWALINIFKYKEMYQNVDFETLAEKAELYGHACNPSTFWFDISIPLFAILIGATLLSLASLGWKLYVMKSEREAIGKGR
jgi:hypothetical protein